MGKSENSENTEKKTNIKILGGISILFVIGAWVYTFFSFDIPGFNIKLKPNEFGDMFGGLNALFTGLAFAGIIITILLQREDLKSQQAILKLQLDQLELQKKELADTREVLVNQQEEMAQQNKTLKLQQFENTLFSMIENFNGIIEFINFQNKDSGRVAIQSIITQSSRLVVNKPIEDVEKWFKRYDVHFGPYFRMLYNILKFIDKTDVEKKQFYSFIIRDQLSEDEVYLLALFGMRTDNDKEYRNLIEEYGLLRLLDTNLPRNRNIKEYYSSSAFTNPAIL